MSSVKVWDPFVRLFHWTIVLTFFLNLVVLDEDHAAHTYVGYVLFGFVLFRLIWGFVGPTHARFSSFWPGRMAIRQHIDSYRYGRKEMHLSHNPFGAIMVFNLIATLLLICVTGVLLSDLNVGHVDFIESAHEFLVNYALVCVILHVVGVVVESLRSGINLTGAMITGRKNIPEDTWPEGTRDAK